MRPARTVSISLPPDLAKEADRVARLEGRTRSEMFREAVRQYIARRARWDRIFSYGEDRARTLGLGEDDVAGIVKQRRRAGSRRSRRP